VQSAEVVIALPILAEATLVLNVDGPEGLEDA
jgi:hypothetical protein